MAPQRVTDAANVSPYPFVVRQERQPPSPPENADRGPHVKGKKVKAKPRAERNPRQEEEPRFNTGPRNIRVPPANRGGRRGFRMPGRAYPEDQNGIPDYPPPSFQEAMTTPPVSVCSSTTSLALAPTIPLAIPENIPEQPEESVETVARNPLEEMTASDNASDSDESIFIIDPNSVPVCSTDLPRGAALEERIKSDWRKRHGMEFPKKPAGESSSKSSECADGQNINRGRTTARPPMLVNIDPDVSSDTLSPMSSPKRRFMSLSPLRTIFPRSPGLQDRATLSAHPSPSSSPYPTSRSMFFRSSTSLATASFLGLPLLSSPSSGKSETLTRKIFKGKERAKDPELKIDAWEVLSEDAYAGVDKEGKEKAEHPRSLMSAVESLQSPSKDGTSPTRSQSFTFGSQVADDSGTTQLATPSEDAQSDELHLLGLGMTRVVTEAALRDWKGPSTAFIDRPINRSRSPVSETSQTNATSISSPTSPTIEFAPMPAGPPLTTVRVRVTAPPHQALILKHTAHVAYHSRLRVDARPNIVIDDQSTAAAAMYQRALDTPLPMTPVFYSHFDYGGSVAALSLDELPLTPIHTSARHVPDLLTDSISAHRPFATPPLSISVHPSATLVAPTSVVNTSSLEEPMTPMRHHYAGRPLPRPPPSAAAAGRVGLVDSTYASPESSSQGHGGAEKNGRSYNSCPEGLLIDLEDTTLDSIPASGASTPRSDEGRFQSHLHLPVPMSQASSSSVDLLQLADSTSALTFNSMLGTSTPLRPGSPNTSHVNPPQSSVLSELTDLDLLASRLAESEPNGSDYESLLLVSELIGPASPSAHAPSAQMDISQKASPNGNMSLIGRIEVKRRRQLNDGRVKLKLTLLDVAVDKCGICLSQFKDADMAVLASICQHSFHERCLERWLARSKTCPLCRVQLDADVR